jgi:preprotein translocase subunit Sec63
VTGYYEILEVKKDCDEADVKKAYRKVRYSIIHCHDACPTFLQPIVGARTAPG